MPLSPLGSTTTMVEARDGTSLLTRRWPGLGRITAHLLLIPDVHEDSSAWDAWARPAQDIGLDIEAVDLRGRGGSNGQLSWPALLDDIEERLAAVRARAGDGLVGILALGVSATLALDYAFSGRPKPDAMSAWTPMRVLPPALAIDPSNGGFFGPLRATLGRRPAFATDFAAAVARINAGARTITVREVGHHREQDIAGMPLDLQFFMPEVFSKQALPGITFPTFSGQNRAHDIHGVETSPHVYGGVPSWLESLARRRAPEAFPRSSGHTVNELLPRKEARALFKAYVASEPERLAAFEQTVTDRGGPQPGVDRASMAALGAWMIDALAEGAPTDPEPYWAESWRIRQGPEARLDTPTMWLIDGLAAHLVRGYATLWPEIEWELDTAKSSINYQEPVFGNFSIPGHARNVIRAARSEPPDLDWLGAMWDRQVETAAAYRAKQEAGETDGATDDDDPLPYSEVSVEPLEEPMDDLGVDLGLWIPEATEWAIGEAAFADLDKRIAALPGVRTVVWEDREVMYAAQEPGRTPEQLRDAIVALLRADAERQQAIEAEEDEAEDG